MPPLSIVQTAPPEMIGAPAEEPAFQATLKLFPFSRRAANPSVQGT